MSDRTELVRQRLAALAPARLDVIDESGLHAGHEGSKNGASHFRVIISSARFDGLTPVARHRLVYDLLHDLIPYPIHALAIIATPVLKGTP
jgi:BolA family transcriptional regulator, general stress-responsive regulator